MTKIVELINTHCDRVAPDTSLRDVASLMMSLRISSVIVVDQGVAVGIITEHDLLRATRRHHSPEHPARSVMSSPVYSVPEDTEFHRA